MDDSIKIFIEAATTAFKSTAYYRATGNTSEFDKFYFANKLSIEEKFSNKRKLILLLRGFANSNINHLTIGKRNILSFILGKRSPKKSWSLIVGEIADKIGSCVMLDTRPLSHNIDVEHGVSSKTRTTFLYFSDKYWFDAFKIMVSKAYFIFIIPDDSQGFRQEIEFISQNQITKKTMVLMPPTIFPQNELFEAETGSAWNFTQARLSKFGYNLPDYDNLGCIYIPKNDFSAGLIYQFKPVKDLKDTYNEVEQGIDTLLKHVPEENHITSEIFIEVLNLLTSY